MPRYHNIKSFYFDETTDDVLAHLLNEAMMLRAKADGAEAAYKQASAKHFSRAFRKKYGCHYDNAIGYIQYADAKKDVELVSVKFSWEDEMQVEYRYKLKSGKWAKGTCTENASYVLVHFVLEKSA